MKNPYEVLGITPSATNEELKTAYRTLAKKYHPDNYTDSAMASYAEEKMKEINEAYDEILRIRTNQQTSSGTSYTSDPFDKHSATYKLIRETMNRGDYNTAEMMLNDIIKDERSAEWYYLKGCILANRGYFFDALKNLDTACTMAPDNQEYAQARDRLRQTSNTYGNTYNQQSSGCNMCDVCSFLVCMDCLCRGC